MRPTRTLTDPLNMDLEARLRQRFAEFPRQAAEPELEATEGDPVPVEQPLPVAEDGISSEELAIQQLRPLYENLLRARRQLNSLSGELTRRKLTDSQFKDLGIVEDWLGVTKSIARQYGEALIQMEQILEQLIEGVIAYRAKFNKDPSFLEGE